MSFEQRPSSSKEALTSTERKISELAVGDLVLDAGEYQPITNIITEPDGGVRILIQGAPPRHFDSDELDESIEIGS